jgi:ribosomal protein S18 acetylase RimI-like enzyme
LLDALQARRQPRRFRGEAHRRPMARRRGIAIRAIEPGEEHEIVAIARDLQAHEAALYDRSKPAAEIGDWYVDALKKDVAEYKGLFLVAEADGAIAGYATLLFMDSAGERDEVFYTYAHVSDLGVLKSHRGEGIGTALLSACEDAARAAGQKWLRLGVIASNTGALRLYERAGFEAKFHAMEKKLS